MKSKNSTATRIHEEHIRNQYLQKTDGQLSEDLGVSIKTVAGIRKQYGLNRSEATEKKLQNKVASIQVKDPQEVETSGKVEK